MAWVSLSLVAVGRIDSTATNHRPGLAQPFALGSGEVLAEVDIAPRLVPELAKYERFWLSAEMYEQVKTSLSMALSGLG